MPTTDLLSISDLLEPATVRVGLPGGDKDAVLDALVDLLDGHPAVDDLEQVRADVHARERQMSTGVGKGLGLPHARSGAVRETVAAFAVMRQGVAFDAIDAQPVRLVFLLVGPEGERSRHIRLLSRISRLMNQDDFRASLLAAETPEVALDLFREAEEALAS